MSLDWKQEGDSWVAFSQITDDGAPFAYRVRCTGDAFWSWDETDDEISGHLPPGLVGRTLGEAKMACEFAEIENIRAAEFEAQRDAQAKDESQACYGLADIAHDLLMFMLEKWGGGVGARYVDRELIASYSWDIAEAWCDERDRRLGKGGK